MDTTIAKDIGWMNWWPGSDPIEAGTRNAGKSVARKIGWSGCAHLVTALAALLRIGRSMMPDEDAITASGDYWPLLGRANRRSSRSTRV